MKRITQIGLILATCATPIFAADTTPVALKVRNLTNTPVEVAVSFSVNGHVKSAIVAHVDARGQAAQSGRVQSGSGVGFRIACDGDIRCSGSAGNVQIQDADIRSGQTLTVLCDYFSDKTDSVYCAGLGSSAAHTPKPKSKQAELPQVAILN